MTALKGIRVLDLGTFIAGPHCATILGEFAIAVPDVVPRLSATPGEIRWLGEGVGAQNEEIFRDLLGLKDNDIRQMRDDGII